LATTINGSLTQNGGNTVLNSDANASTILIGTGLAAKNIQIGNPADGSIRTLGGKFLISDNAVSPATSLLIETAAATGAFSCLDTFMLNDVAADIRSLRFTASTVAPRQQFLKARANPATGAGANVQNGDALGQVDFIGFRQTGALADAFIQGSQIQSIVTDVNAGLGLISSNLRFNTRTPGAATLTVKVTITDSGALQINEAGQTLAVQGGAVTDFIGQAVLAAGTVTVNNTNITANDKIFLSVSLPGGTQGILSYAIAAGASFTITSTNALDTSTVEYFIVRQI